jgi:hypothetical protein
MGSSMNPPRPSRSTKAARQAALGLRKDGRHCPLCLKPLPRIAGQHVAARKCLGCGAQHRLGKRCAKCDANAIWEAEAKAACQTCGVSGSKLRVVAGALEGSRGPKGS